MSPLSLAKRVLPVPLAVALHQPLSAAFYAAIWTLESGRLDFFAGYAREYLVWGQVAPRTFGSVDALANIGSLIVLTVAAAAYFKNHEQ